MQKRRTDYGKITENYGKLRKTKKLMIKITENYGKNYGKNKKSKFFIALLFLIFIFYCDSDILKS